MRNSRTKEASPSGTGTTTLCTNLLYPLSGTLFTVKGTGFQCKASSTQEQVFCTIFTRKEKVRPRTFIFEQLHLATRTTPNL